MKGKHLSGCFISALLVSVIAFGYSSVAFSRGQSVPAGFGDYLVFMATGTIPYEAHPDPEISGCGAGLFCDGDYFHRVIMGRSVSEVEETALRAKEYFLSRFGIDVDTLEQQGRLSFESFFIDPRGEYRAYTVAGKKVPAKGWVIRDGGFIATVLDPAGIPLGGEFAGSGLPPVPQGGILIYGDYNILKTNRRGRKTGEIIFNYRSDMPMIANSWGELIINCQISRDGFESGVADGKAQGMGLVFPSQEGLTLSWRNVLTINPAGSSGD